MKDLTTPQHEAYLASLERHIANVREAGTKLGVPYKQLLIHDQSKFSEEEFGPYARYFYNDDGSAKRPEDRTHGNMLDFAKAWLHHIHNNPHHWQYWIFAGESELTNNVTVVNNCLEMPFNYISEMVADWMGASMSYTGSWDMSDWLVGNIGKVQMHPRSYRYLGAILSGFNWPKDFGYGKIAEEYMTGDY